MSHSFSRISSGGKRGCLWLRLRSHLLGQGAGGRDLNGGCWDQVKAVAGQSQKQVKHARVRLSLAWQFVAPGSGIWDY